MNLLAFDTATPSTVVALSAAGEQVLSELRHDPAPGERPGHAAQLLPLAAQLLDAAGLTFADLDRIAVGVGPGTFTGLRIGIATARALAQGSGAELAAVSTLRALAAGTGAGDDAVLAVLDARRGEAFAALYEGEQERIAPAALAPDRLGELAASGRLAVGDGAVRFRDVLEALGVEVPPDDSPLHRVGGTALARLGAVAAPATEGVLPEYLRLPDAELALRRKTSP